MAGGVKTIEAGGEPGGEFGSIVVAVVVVVVAVEVGVTTTGGLVNPGESGLSNEISLNTPNLPGTICPFAPTMNGPLVRGVNSLLISGLEAGLREPAILSSSVGG